MQFKQMSNMRQIIKQLGSNGIFNMICICFTWLHVILCIQCNDVMSLFPLSSQTIL